MSRRQIQARSDAIQGHVAKEREASFRAHKRHPRAAPRALWTLPLRLSALLAPFMIACAGQEAPVTPQTAENGPPISAADVVFFADKTIPSFPPVPRRDVLVIALSNPELPPGFLRGGKELVLADDVPSREAPHRVIGVMSMPRISQSTDASAVIRAYVDAGRLHGATAVVHSGCIPLTKDCKATAVRLAAAPPEPTPPPRAPTATWPAPTTVPAVPIGRVVTLPSEVFVSAVGAFDGGRAVIAGSALGKAEDTKNRWIARVAKDGKLDFKILGEGDVFDLQSRPDGSVVLSGIALKVITRGNMTGPEELAWVADLAPDNKIVWEQTFAGEMSARADGLALLPTGGAVATGIRMPRALGRCDALLAVVDGTGKTAWDATIAGRGYQFFTAATVLASGRIMTVGAQETSADDNLYDGFILVTEPGGEVITKRALGRSGWNKLIGVTATSDGGAIAVGQSSPTGMWIRQIGTVFVVRMDAAGQSLWTQTIGERVVRATRAVEVRGGAMFAATKLGEKGDLSSFLVKIDQDGNDTWEPIQVGPTFEVSDIALAPDGGIVLAAGEKRSSRQIWLGRSGPR